MKLWQTAYRKLPECNSREVAGMIHGLSMYCVNSPEYGRGVIDGLVQQVCLSLLGYLLSPHTDRVDIVAGQGAYLAESHAGPTLCAVSVQQHLIADCNGPDAASILLGLSRFNYRPDETMLRLLARLTQGGLTPSTTTSDSSNKEGREWTGRLMSNTLAACAKLDWIPPSAFWEAVFTWFETTEVRAVERLHMSLYT